jgi:hypothetical protein
VLDERLAELLAGEAAADLDTAEQAELQRLAAGLDGGRRAAMFHTAALTQVALCRASRAATPLPHGLRLRLQAQAALFVSGERHDG